MASAERNVQLIGWRIAGPRLDQASVRYRALLPALVLEKNGYKNRIFTRPKKFSCLRGLTYLVFVKVFTHDDYLLAAEAVRRKIPVILDLCDNIFIDNYGKKTPGMASQVFRQMATVASVIVVSTEALAEVVQQQIYVPRPIVVVPDGIETKTKFLHMQRLHDSIIGKPTPKHQGIIGRNPQLKKWRDRVFYALAQQYTLLADWIDRSRGHPVHKTSGSGAKRVLWFGVHGASYANFGMLDLLEIKDQLESVAKDFPVELVVVSNNRQKFNDAIKPAFTFPTRYVEWSNRILRDELRHTTVVVIPNSKDPFSICKSPNRAILALRNKIPVVATETPATKALSECVVLDEFSSGLRGYFSNADKCRRDVAVAASVIESLYGDAQILSGWKNVLGQCASTTTTFCGNSTDCIDLSGLA